MGIRSVFLFNIRLLLMALAIAGTGCQATDQSPEGAVELAHAALASGEIEPFRRLLTPGFRAELSGARISTLRERIGERTAPYDALRVKRTRSLGNGTYVATVFGSKEVPCTPDAGGTDWGVLTQRSCEPEIVLQPLIEIGVVCRVSSRDVVGRVGPYKIRSESDCRISGFTFL